MHRLFRVSAFRLPLRRPRGIAESARLARGQLCALTQSSRNGFLSEDVAFDAFELDPRLTAALDRNGFQRPSQIQALGMQPLLERRDVVLAAETGSGKTLAYLLPLMTHLLKEKQLKGVTPPPPSPIFENDFESDVDDTEHWLPRAQKRVHQYAWVLCPSVDLCQQVQSVIQSLTEGSDASLLTSEVSPAGLSRYTERPDILLGTPGSILGALPDMHRTMLRALLTGVSHVIVDEADLMLTGSYRTQLDRLFQMLYMNERDTAIQALSRHLGLTKDAFLSLPRHLRRAGLKRGIQGMLDAGYEPQQPSDGDSSLDPYWKRQFVLAGATIPSLGTKNVRDEIAQLFPAAEIVSTANLHRISTQVSYNWISIEPSERMEAVLTAIQTDPSFENGSQGRILVFTKDAPTVDALASFLGEQGVGCVAFHKKLGGYLRRANLERFRKETGIVMVCTDGLSRGMDIEGVTHVIQADFAPSAISFLHRVGRTARAGGKGEVTCLCTDGDRDLADAIRDGIEAGTPIEGAFSRNRSFRKKMRRYGVYVPRGVTPTDDSRRLEDCTEMGCPI